MPLREQKIMDPVPTAIFRRAVAASDIELTHLIEKEMTAHTGRPRTHSWLCIFTLLAATAIESQGRLLLSDAARVGKRLTPKQRRRIGLSSDVEYSHLESALADLAAVLKPAVNTRTGEVIPPRLPLSHSDLMTAIASGVVPQQYKNRQTIAIDSTDLEAYAARRSYGRAARPDVDSEALPESDFKPPKDTANQPGWPKTGADGRMQHTCDPDAREGYRAGHSLALKGTFIGWDWHLATNIPDFGEEGMAPLIIGISLHPAGSSKGEAGIDLLDALDRAGRSPRAVIVDRGYSYLKARNWSLPLFRRGIDQTIGLHPHQRGTRPGPIPGTIWVDGGLFLDALPKRLRSLPGYSLKMTAAQRAHLAEQYDKRKPYAFTPLGTPNRLKGSLRVRGPALTKKLRCPNNPETMRLNAGNRPTLDCLPEGCACSKTLTLYPEDQLTTRSLSLFGTTAWRRDYGRRSGVESVNASVKWHHSALRRGSIRVKGTLRTGIAAAFIAAANNIRVLLQAYGWDVGKPSCPPEEVLPLPTIAKEVQPRRRKTGRRKPRPKESPPETPATTNWLPITSESPNAD
jgi:hypothetical protein